MMQNYVDGRREENDLLICLFTSIYNTCKISLEGYKRNVYPTGEVASYPAKGLVILLETLVLERDEEPKLE